MTTKIMLLSALAFFPILLFAQSTESQTDTIVYEKHGKPQRLYPIWAVNNLPDTFEVYQTRYEIENGDTITSEQQNTHFLFTVDTVTPKEITLSFFINSDIYKAAIDSKNCKVTAENPDYVRMQFRLPPTGGNSTLSLLNCSELQTLFTPMLQQRIDCERASPKNQDGFSKRLLDRQEANLKDCQNLRWLVQTESSFFQMWQGVLAPKKGKLRYQVVTKSDDKRINQYFVVKVQDLPNGNRRYELTEDTTKAPPLEVRMFQEIGRMENVVKGRKAKPVIEAAEILVFELDVRNQLVALLRTTKSRLVHNGKDKQSYSEYRIERQ